MIDRVHDEYVVSRLCSDLNRRRSPINGQNTSRIDMLLYGIDNRRGLVSLGAPVASITTVDADVGDDIET